MSEDNSAWETEDVVRHQPKEPSTVKGIRTKKKLLQSAEKIFGKKGYYQTSITDITQESNVAQGSFYNYFSSKREIFEEVIKQLSKDFRSTIRQEVRHAQSPKEAQIIGIRTFLKWVKNHPDLYSIVQQTVVVDEQLYRWYYERIATGYKKGIEEGIYSKDFRDLDVETIVYCLMGISQFIGMRWVYWEGQDVPEHVFESVVQFIFDGLEQRGNDGV